MSWLPHGNVAAVNNDGPQFFFCVLPLLGLWGRQQRVLLAYAPLIAVRSGHAGRRARPVPHQLSEHRVGVCGEAQFSQHRAHLRRGITQFPEEVSSELELFTIWLHRVWKWTLAWMCLVHPEASGTRLSSIDHKLEPPYLCLKKKRQSFPFMSITINIHCCTCSEISTWTFYWCATRWNWNRWNICLKWTKRFKILNLFKNKFLKFIQLDIFISCIKR